ncbi:diacylglycerol/lipid kinase family protein [Paucilactobacillus wasatchensis]|uniref:Transcription regulator n=1 Tax=Paucilactobacillus wasatchensis TaxID=1335616 RepID=A0A0D1A5C5_9LACO|nr:diacylglycerol kinase family protein [Paucilactobacillus wasatchensis]KIS03060.1 Transcription regulator [Paucilactobacillus wasatchensis]
MTFLIILNEHAGSGNAKATWELIQPVLQQKNINYTFEISQYPGHTTYLTQQYIKNIEQFVRPVILVIGGDGTLHEALNGAMSSQQTSLTPLAYIPAGSGNDFARGLGMASKPLDALNQILNCHQPMMINIGHYLESMKNEKGYFINNIGIGFDAAVVSRTNTSTNKRRLNKYHLGSLAYLSSVISVLYNQDPFPLMVQVNKQRTLFQKAFLVTTSNHPYFGGGVAILPDASVQKPDLELIVIERKNWLIILWVAILIILGKHLKSRFVHVFKNNQIHLTTTSIEHGQIDGEIMGNRFFDLSMNITQYPFWIDTSIKKIDNKKR